VSSCGCARPVTTYVLEAGQRAHPRTYTTFAQRTTRGERVGEIVENEQRP